MDLDPAGICDHALHALVAAIGSDNLPENRYTHAGEPVFDRLAGEAFVVHATRLYEGDPALAVAAAGFTPSLINDLWSIELGATIVRCLSDEALAAEPDPADLDALGQIALTDGVRLLRGAQQADQLGTLIPSHRLTVIGPVVWTGPEGGMIATTVVVNAGIGA